MCLNQIIGHVIGVACREPDTFQTVHFVQFPNELRQAPLIARRAHPMIGIYVLSEQRDFTHTAFHQIARLSQNAINGTRYLCATRIRNHTKRTKFVTALLDRQKGRRCPFRFGPVFQLFKFILFREICVDGLFPSLRARLQFRQAMIALRTNNQIDCRLAAHDFFAFRLRNTSCNTNFQVRFVNFQCLHPTQFRINFFCCFFPNVTGI